MAATGTAVAAAAARARAAREAALTAAAVAASRLTATATRMGTSTVTSFRRARTLVRVRASLFATAVWTLRALAVIAALFVALGVTSWIH